MSDTFDFVVVGAGSAGAVIASRLSEDPSCRVALLEAGHRPPPEELIPAACPALQKNPATDWMYTADAGKCGLGLEDGRMMMPRGKMLGGSSGMNYMAYVRGHPGDFDAWAEGGATGWGYRDVLPYFQKSEGLAPSDDIAIDAPAHSTSGPLGVSVRSPILSGAREFVDAAVAAGIPRGDYNGRDRGGPDGVVSLLQTSTRAGKRSSTYHAFLEGDVEQRPNLTIITGAQVTRVLLSGSLEHMTATGVEYRTDTGETLTALATREVVLSGGAIGSPHLLLLSGIGPTARARGPRHHVSRRFAARRQAPEGPSPGRPLFSSARGRRLDERSRRRIWPRRHGRVGDHRAWPRVLVAVRGVRVVLHGPGRPSQPRRAGGLLRVRIQPRHLAAVPSRRTRTSTSTTRRGDWRSTSRA